MKKFYRLPAALLLIVCAIGAVSGQSNKFSQVYKPGNNLYVYSVEGLSMRGSPDPKAPVIIVVKFGEKVEVLADAKPRTAFTSTGVPGTWVKVRQGTKDGYMFDGFLSRYPPMPASQGSPEDFQNYLRGQFKVKSQTDTPPDKETYNAYLKIVFANGIEYSWIAGEGGASIGTSFPASAFTFQEVFLIARLVYPEFFTSKKCAYKDNDMSCGIEDDENTSLTIKKTGTNYIIDYGHAD